MLNQKIKKINWEEQFKIRVRRNASIKHEHIKLSIVLSLLDRYKKNLRWIRIYTEYPITSKNKTKIVDVYLEDVKNNEIICYEIQKDISKKWLKETSDFFLGVDRIFFNTDWILIRENDYPQDIEQLHEKVIEDLK